MFKKILNLFKNKSFVRIFAIALAAIIGVTSTLSIMLSSYFNYKVYYDTLMEEKEYQKYLQSLGLEFLGISAELTEDAVFFTGGNSVPVNDDFQVTAHFTEKGKEFDEILKSSDFEIAIPEDFSLNGGKVTVSYAYQPEKEEGATEDPEPIVKTAEVDVSLTPVVLTELKVTGNPYRVYYSDAMEFDAEGMTLEASYNNGQTIALTEDDIDVITTGALTAGTENAKVSYTNGDVTLEADVPITVETAAEYDDGDVIGIKAEGDVYVVNGQNLSEATPTIRATYDNGNRLLINSDKYTVSGNVATASFVKNCILSVELKENPIINCRAAATVRYGVEAEDATAVGGAERSVDEYVYDDGAYTKVGTATVMEGFANGNTLTFNINSNSMAKGSASLRIANTTASEVKLADIVTLKVNGREIAVPKSLIMDAKADAQGYVFTEYALPQLVLNKGDNTVQLTFKNMTNVGVAFDKFTVETKYDGVFYSAMDEYLVSNLENETTPNLTVEKIKDFHTVLGGTYIHGMCTDGTYIYATRTTYSKGLRGIMVTKHDATTGEVLASSVKTAAGAYESNAGITYYDGKIIVYFADGTEWCIDPSLSGSWTEYTGFTFEGLDGVGLRDVYYSNARQQFAVLAGTNVTVFGKDMKAITSFGMQKETGGYIMRMSGSNDYLYVVFSKDGAYQPIVHIYDWEGEFIGRVVVPNGADVVGSNINLAKTNVQGMVAMNDELYFAFLCFSQGNGLNDSVALLKVSYPEIAEDLEFNLSVGEYVTACVDNGATAAATAMPTVGSIGRIETGGSYYSMAGVSDGEYIYYSAAGGGNKNAVLYKVDPETYEVLAKTVSFEVATVEGDNSRVFIKDGLLYCIATDGSMYSIALADFNGNNCAVTKVTDLSFADYGTAKGATWNDAVGKFAVMTNNGKLHIVKEDGSAIVRDIAIAYSYMKVSSVTSDDKYVYVSYTRNNAQSIPVDVFTWDGTKVGTVMVSGFSLGQNGTEAVNFNVQSLYIHNGKMRAVLCSWDSGYQTTFDWTINVDQSVFAAQ